MRIRNKLITVQLIMNMTLILSIVIFTLHMSKIIKLDDAEIIISQLDSSISQFKISSDASINKRDTPINIHDELENMYLKHKDLIQFFQESSIFNSAELKDQTTSLWNSYTQLKGKSLQKFLNSIKITNNPGLIKHIKDRGIDGALKSLKEGSGEVGTSSSDDIVYEVLLHKIVLLYSQFKPEYENYLATWNITHELVDARIEKLNSSFVVITIIFLISLLFVAFFFNYMITSKITRSLNDINSTLSKMTDGDFTSTLHISKGDEFGELGEHFNRFIEQLWKKLDSMNVIMNDIAQAMNEDLSLDKIQTNILDNITSHIVTDSAAIFSLKDGVLKMTGSKGHFPPFYPIETNLSDDKESAAKYLTENDVQLDIPIVFECMNTKKPVIVRECFNDNRFPQCKHESSALYINSLMMVPLINAGEIIGLFVVQRITNKTIFSDLDISNFSSFSDYAALTIDTLEKYTELLEKFEMQKDIGVAADIQQSLVPGKMPKIKGISSSAYTLAAKGVSGDYYDFFRMNKHTIGATVCDVAGKGVPASLVMVMIRTILRLVSSPARGAAETLTMLNKSISGKVDVDRYATMGFFKIDLKNMKLNYSNAAHHPILIFRQKTQKFYEVDAPGLPVGIDRDAVFNEKRVTIHPGDIIFMYTDGFPEARNHDGDEYSTSRMLRAIKLHCNYSAEKILTSVVKDMQDFTARASQHDDQTILIIKIDEEKKK